MTGNSIRFDGKLSSGTTAALLGGVLAGSLLVSSVLAQSTAPAANKAPATAIAAAPAQAAKAAKPAAAPSRYLPDRFAGKAGRYYRLVWGVDSLSVKAAESGELIRFSYRILDPQKAKILNDKKFEAFLNSPEHRIQLVIPSLEKVGQLRQSNSPEAGRSYWMAFSNPHRAVKRGDRVNVVIGQFHADGLVVD